MKRLIHRIRAWWVSCPDPLRFEEMFRDSMFDAELFR